MNYNHHDMPPPQVPRCCSCAGAMHTCVAAGGQGTHMLSMVPRTTAADDEPPPALWVLYPKT